MELARRGRGRADLLRSVEFVLERAGAREGLVLVGWSIGGLAAAGLAVHASEFGVRIAHTVCLAGAFAAPDPISGQPPSAATSVADPTPFSLMHGVADDVIPAAVSQDFAAVLERNGWPVNLVELVADHGTIAGAVYDPVADRYSGCDGLWAACRRRPGSGADFRHLLAVILAEWSESDSAFATEALMCGIDHPSAHKVE